MEAIDYDLCYYLAHEDDDYDGDNDIDTATDMHMDALYQAKEDRDTLAEEYFENNQENVTL